MDKKIIIEAVLKELERQKMELKIGLRSAEQAAVDSPGAMQSHSDTTKSQMHTLAMNIENLVREKETAIHSLNNLLIRSSEKMDSIEEGAIVETEGENKEKCIYIIVPEGGAGATVDHNGIPAISITAATPLGKTLLNKKIGETAVFKNKSGERKIKIVDIS